jgi:hypothetical protein
MEQSSKAKNGNENICSNSASVMLLLTIVNYLINGLGFCVRNTILRRKGNFKNYSHHKERSFKIKLICDNQKFLAGRKFHSTNSCVSVQHQSISQIGIGTEKSVFLNIVCLQDS